MRKGGSGLLTPVAFATLLVFYVVWAAMHDLAHGDEGTVEIVALVTCVAVSAMLYRFALRVLSGSARMAWLLGTGLVIAVFCAGAVGSVLQPRYARDPMLGALFLVAGLPAAGLIAYRIVREAR